MNNSQDESPFDRVDNQKLTDSAAETETMQLVDPGSGEATSASNESVPPAITVQAVEGHEQDASSSLPRDQTDDQKISTPPAAHIEDAQLPSSLQDRLRVMESKMGLVDTMYGLHESTKDALDYRETLPLWAAGTAPYKSDTVGREHLKFLSDSMWYMRWIRNSHEGLLREEAAQRAKATAAKEKKPHREAALRLTWQSMAKIFLDGEQLKIMKVGWGELLLLDRKPQRTAATSVSTPIEVVSGEPDTRILIQLAEENRGKHSSRTIPDQVEWTTQTPDEDGKPPYHQPLPERIKITSVAIAALLESISKTGEWSSTADDDSMMILRPYQDLVYHHQQLQAELLALEETLKSWDGKEKASTESMMKNGEEGCQHGDGAPVKATNQDTEKDVKDDDSASHVGSDLGDTSEKDPSESVTTLLHLRCLLKFVDTAIKPKQDYVSGPSCTHVSFHDLWYLFSPGDEIIDQKENQAFVVLRVQNPEHQSEDPWDRWNKPLKKGSDSDSEDEDEEDENPFTLYCAYIDFDGKIFGPVSKKFKILPFDGLKHVKSLPAFPVRFSKTNGLRRHLIDRGRKLLDVSNFKSMYYTGMTLDTRHDIDSQVVIDFNEALADEKRRKDWEPTIGPISTARPGTLDPCEALCCYRRVVHTGSEADSKRTEDYIKTLLPENSLGAPSLILSPRSLEDTISGGSELTETELLIMTSRVFGFVLRSRKWAQLDLGLLRYENSDVRDFTVNAFEKLELPDGHREMVKSLVIQHFRSRQSTSVRNEQMDLIKGKGKGLILLLHGAPGVGKTTTAEGIAEQFRKPLFQITCGDLGTTAAEVESELEKNFALASRWGCILLLDEADVFLASRERMDFTRNGLVAVFLRVLEYYTGILILTTNRVGDFDEAFASRIHMSLYYPALNEEKTVKVFKLNLDLISDQFKRQNRTFDYDMSAIENFARNHFREHSFYRWNGRQIRNACQTALALAEYDAQLEGGNSDVSVEIDTSVKVKLQIKYFNIVQRAYLDFDNYLGEVYGTRGDRRAFDHRLRARTGTPHDSGNSRFSRQSEQTTGQRPGLPPHQQNAYRYSSDAPSPSYTSHGDPSGQPYPHDAPGTPITQRHSQPRYSPQPSQSWSSQYQSESMGNRGDYEGQPFGQPQSSHQNVRGPLLAPRQDQGQYYGSPRGGMQGSDYGRDGLQRPGSSFDDPLPFQQSQPQHRMRHGGQEEGFRPGHPVNQGSTSGSHTWSQGGQDRLGVEGEEHRAVGPGFQ